MSQAFIRVDAGTGSAVDFSLLNGGTNNRQVISVGDSAVDAMYATVDANGLHVTGTFKVSSNQSIGVYGVSGGTLIGVNATITNAVNVSGTITNTVAVTVGNFPAAQNVTGSVNAYQQTDAIYNGASILTPLFTSVAFGATGNNTVLAGVSTKKIRVLSMAFLASTAVGMYATDAAGGTIIFASATHTSQFAANGGIVLPYNPLGWFQTNAGNALVFNISTTSSVGGSMSYITV